MRERAHTHIQSSNDDEAETNIWNYFFIKRNRFIVLLVYNSQQYSSKY